MDLQALGSDGFGHWLAGLIDGEGCFTISPNRPGFVCRLSLSLREDDGAIVEEIGRRLGVGRVIYKTVPVSAGFQRRPQVMWRVQKKDDCQQIVALFRAFPLRAKKARDFAVWTEAVEVMATMQPVGSKWNRRRLAWKRVAELKEELRRTRDGRARSEAVAGDEGSCS